MRGDKINDDFKFPHVISGDFCNCIIKSQCHQIADLDITTSTNSILGIQTLIKITSILICLKH